jgi:glycosyltransferase involved in cell wall biosynthesis
VNAANPLVTVYITNFNYGRFIRHSIDSLLAQSFQDFECIIIDDGSTDDSLEIIAKYQELPGFFVIKQKNKGLTKSNNIALKMARGTFIMRLDADDFLEPTALEELVKRMQEGPDFALVFPNYFLVDENGAILQEYKRIDFEVQNVIMDRPAHGACTLIRTKVLQDLGGYNESFTCQDGYDLWLKVIDNYKVAHLPKTLFSYRQHGANLTSNQEKLFSTRASIMELHANQKLRPIPKTVAIIPVRGGKFDPRSLPLRLLGGKCLIDWTIDHALESKYIEQVVVTTPDEAVLSHVDKKYGSAVLKYKRSESLAEINSDIAGTLIDVVNSPLLNGKIYEAMMVLYIECPFRSTIYIDKSINTMRLFEVDSVDGVMQDSSLFYQYSEHGLRLHRPDNLLQLERDDLFRRCGGINLIRIESLKKYKKTVAGNIGHILMDQKSSFMIKSELDFFLANCIVEKENKANK